MPPSELEDAVVVYPIRDLLEKISKDQSTGFAELKVALATKADKSDLAEIRGELKSLDSRVDTLETEKTIRDRSASRWRWIAEVLGTIGVILATYGVTLNIH